MGFHKGDNVERIHMKFCKNILGVRRYTPNALVLAELSRLDMKTKRLLRIIKYWLKILTLNENVLVKKVYEAMRREADEGVVNWASLLRDKLMSLGFGEVWYVQKVYNNVLFINNVKIRINDVYYQELHATLEGLSRGRTYLYFNENLALSSYLEDVNIDKYRIALSKFRLSNHKLQVEIGRWHKPEPIPFNNRICSSCNTLDDEYHLLLECKLYSDIRKIHIPRHFYIRPNMVKFGELLCKQQQKT